MILERNCGDGNQGGGMKRKAQVHELIGDSGRTW